MPKLLRPNEKITFVQTRAPTAMWRYVKGLAAAHASDATATRLCTDAMLEYLSRRPWLKEPWLRPQDLERKAGATGFQQVNLPLSNMDAGGKIVLSSAYLREHGLIDLFDRDKHAFRAAVESGETSKLIYVAAGQLDVSGATFAYTFLYWLSVVKYAPKAVSKPKLDTSTLPAATPVSREATPVRRRTREN